MISLFDVFMACGPLAKLALLSPIILVPLAFWMLFLRPSRARIRIFVLLCLVPVLLAVLSNLMGMSNVTRSLGELGGGVDHSLLIFATAELRLGLHVPMVIAVFFLILGLFAALSAKKHPRSTTPPLLFTGTLGICYFLYVFLLTATFAQESGLLDPGPWTAALVFASIPALVLYFAVLLLLVYRAWHSLDPEFTRTSPGKAVGFLFIPIFNIYWTFQVFWGFAKDDNRFINEKELPVRSLPETGILLAVVLMFLTGGFPIVSMVSLLAILYIAYHMAAGATTLQHLEQDITLPGDPGQDRVPLIALIAAVVLWIVSAYLIHARLSDMVNALSSTEASMEEYAQQPVASIHLPGQRKV